MARQGGYGAVKEYHDDPGYQDNPSTGRFAELCEQISSNIFTINNGANAIKRAMDILGTERDSVQIRDKIHETSQTTGRVVNETTKLIKSLSLMKGVSKQQKLLFSRLKSDFQDAVERFTSLQKRAAEKVKTSRKLGTDKPKPKNSDWLDDNDTSPFMEQEQKREEMQAQDQLIDDDLALIQDREERVRQLESDVLDVNEIFRDLGTMIHEQGEQIDSIEANVERAYGNVEQGTEQLLKASQYQKKSRKKMCILIVIFLIIAAVIAIIIATQVH